MLSQATNYPTTSGNARRTNRLHVYNGFPHYKRDMPNLGACMCLDRCCQGKAGCICRGCGAKDHSHSELRGLMAIECVHSGCHKSIPGDKWSKIRANAEGWYFSKDNKVYCPSHRPQWVTEWRKRRKRK